MEEFKSGFVTIIGRTNVGKSTLINLLVGEKVAAIANKVQTTRNAIKLLKTIGYNSDIINAAENSARYFLENGKWNC